MFYKKLHTECIKQGNLKKSNVQNGSICIITIIPFIFVSICSSILLSSRHLSPLPHSRPQFIPSSFLFYSVLCCFSLRSLLSALFFRCSFSSSISCSSTLLCFSLTTSPLPFFFTLSPCSSSVLHSLHTVSLLEAFRHG